MENGFFIPLAIILSLLFVCCYKKCHQPKDQPQTTVSQENSNSINSPSVPEDTSPLFNDRYIATNDIQTGQPVVVDIASIVTQLCKDRVLPPPYNENQTLSYSNSSANYGTINDHHSNYPSAPPPAYSEVDPQPKTQ